MRQAAIYTRVSSEEQIDGYSLDAQSEVSRHLCEYKGWQVVAEYSDPGRSGKTAIRPGFQAMIQDAQAGRFDVIVVHKLDRFSRSLLDTLSYLGKLERGGVSFISATEDFDFTTPFGKLILAVLGAFAEWYINNLAAEVRKGKRQRAKSGRWNGSLSFGYTTPRRVRDDLQALGEAFKAGAVELSDYSEQADRLEALLERFGDAHDSMAIPCPTDRDGVRLAYTIYATGRYSLSDVARELNAAGYRTITGGLFSKDTVRGMLENRFYLGMVGYVGGGVGNQRAGRVEREWYEGEHEAIISRELFDRVQQVRHERDLRPARRRYRRAANSYLLTGMLICAECGCRFRGRASQRVRKYADQARDRGVVCNRKPVDLHAEKIEADLIDILTGEGLAIPDDWQDRAAELAAQEAARRNRANVDDRHKRARLTGQLERLRQLYVMGDIDDNAYYEQRAVILDDMPPDDAPEPSAPVVAGELVALLQDFDALFAAATLEERREVVALLIDEVYITDVHISAIRPKSTFELLRNCARISRTSNTNAGSGADGHSLPAPRKRAQHTSWLPARAA